MYVGPSAAIASAGRGTSASLALLLVLGCSSRPSDGTAPGREPGGGNGPGGGQPGANPSGGNGTPGGCQTTEAFRSPLRRLTRAEYNNTVRDLLGDRTAPAAGFPPDEVSSGFNNNAAVLGVSPLLAEKYQQAAETLAATAVKDLPALVRCDVARTGEATCAGEFVERFGGRAFRRPLSTAERDRLLALYRLGREGGSFAEGIEVVVRALLQAPAFLYRVEGASAPPAGSGSAVLAPLEGHEVASRLSYLLWGTMPDDRLFAAAQSGELRTAEQVSAMARTMLEDPRARLTIAEFHRQWLGLAVERAAKDAAVYPGFDDELKAGMAAEVSAFVEDVYFGSQRTLTALLTSTRGFVNPALARLYGVAPPAGSGSPAVSLPAEERRGLLSRGAFLAVHALPDQSSPVHRGKLVREQLLCQEMPPQPPGLVVTPPEVDPRRPTRERFAQHSQDAACSGCHRLMDPIGFGFERYDGIGRYRSMEGGRPVDDSGTVFAHDGGDLTFQGAGQLGEKLAASPTVNRCLVKQWYRFAFGRLDGPGDRCSLLQLEAAFERRGDLGQLLVELTRTEAFLHRPAGEGASP